MKVVPLRMCVVCREKKPKTECIRVVSIDGKYLLDESGKINGRGAYVCKNEDCINKCIKTRPFNKAFRHSIDDKLYFDIKENYVDE